MDQAEYHQIPGVKGDFFRCSVLSATLSKAACSRLYSEAMSVKGLKYSLRLECRCCKLGAVHSGATPIDAPSRFFNILICSRCHQSCNRLIRRSICVSCYNREREFMIGRNAKGTVPIYLRRVVSTTILFYPDMRDGAKVRKFDRVTSRMEAVLSTLRLEPKSMCFGWAPSTIIRDAAA